MYEKSSKTFNVGDKVRFIVGSDDSSGKGRAFYTVEACRAANGDRSDMRVFFKEANSEVGWYTSRFELVEEKPMKFEDLKVGDTIFIRADLMEIAKPNGDRNNYDCKHCRGLGITEEMRAMAGTAQKVQPMNVNPKIRAADWTWCEHMVDMSKCTQAKAPEKTDEELLAALNAGSAARAELNKRHPSKLEYQDGEIWKTSTAASHGKTYRLKPKPEFSICLGGWHAELKDGALNVGCQTFTDPKTIMGQLQHLAKGGQSAGQFTAARYGIKYKCHELPWSETDKLLAELEKAYKE